jgi:hypothetical protein
LVRFDNNKYSMAASAVGRRVEVHAYAAGVVMRRHADINGALVSVRILEQSIERPIASECSGITLFFL